MTAIRINPVVVSVSPTNTAQLNRVQPTMHGGGVKKVVAVVAAVAIPIAAPAIASSIAASGVLGAAVSTAIKTNIIAGVASSAIVGAGLGAITAKVTGGNVKAGAIGGAIGGGIGGFGVSRASGAGGLGNASQTGISATADRVLGTNFTGQAATPTTPTAADGTLQQAGLNTGDAGATLSTAPPGTETLVDAADTTLVNATTAPTTGTDVASQLSNTGGATVQNASMVTPPPNAGTATTVAATGAEEAAKKGFTERFMTAVKGIPSAVADKVTDPDALATLTMQAGGQLLGQALAPDPEMPPEQRQLLEERKAELANLKARDEEAFNQQMDAAKQYLQQAQQYDPTYMAFQSANKAAIENQRKLREQYRRSALSRGRDISPAEQRRMELDAARNVSSQYDAGFMQGLTAQNRATQAGLSAIPNASNFATYTNALQNLSSNVASAENTARARSSTAAKNISDLFSAFDTGGTNTKEEKEELGGLGTDEKENAAGLRPPVFGNDGFGGIYT